MVRRDLMYIADDFGCDFLAIFFFFLFRDIMTLMDSYDMGMDLYC
jgi:hypothetical protein